MRISVSFTLTTQSLAALFLLHLDGYSPTIFYDFGDYVNMMLEKGSGAEEVKREFDITLNQLIPYRTNTEYFYTATRGAIKIHSYSGITTSDPSISQRAVDKKNTKWYYATH